MQFKKIVCLAIVALMLICCMSCAKVSNFNMGTLEAHAATQTATTETEPEQNNNTTAGLVIIGVSALGIAGGVVLKVVQKKKKNK